MIMQKGILLSEKRGILMKKTWKAAAAAAAVMACGFSVSAEEPAVYSLDQVVVTASRTPEKELDANADINVVTREEIQKRHYQDVSEALRHIPGVMVMNNSASGQNYSSNSVYINGSNNMVLLIDGVRANTNGVAGAHTPLGDYINMDSIERIEVLKGSASTLYGSDAQGGVINIITRHPKNGEVHSSAGVSFGSFDGEKYHLYNEGSKDGYFWTIEAQKQLQGDFEDAHSNSVINHLNSKALNFKMGKDFDNGSSLVFNYQKYKLDYTRPDDGSFDTTRDDGKKDNDRISLNYSAHLSDRLSNQFTLFRYHDILHDNKNHADNLWNLNFVTSGFSDQITYKMDHQLITGGVDYYQYKIRNYYSTSSYELDGTEYISSESFQNKKTSNTAFYLQDIWNINSKWNLTPGIRFDHHSTFGDHTTPAVTLGYKQSGKTNYYISYKEFFVAPDLYQLYSTSYGNRDLKPQEGGTASMGASHQWNDSLYGTFSIYRQHAKNMIAYNSSTYRYYNTGKLDSYGWNAQLHKNVTDALSMFLGYTYTHVDRSASGANSNLNGFLPKGMLDVGIDYQHDKLSASVTGKGIFHREGAWGTNPVSQYKNYWVWDTVVNYQITPQAQLYVKLNNIFNQFYTETGTYSSYGEYWYSAPGRNYEAGVNFRF